MTAVQEPPCASFGAIRQGLAYSFCLPESAFELERRLLRELDAAVEIVRIEQRLDVLEAVAGDRRDLGHRAPRQRQPGGRGSAEIMEVQFTNPGGAARVIERCAESILSPRAAAAADQDLR